LAAGGEGPGGGDDLPFHLPLAVRAAGVQRGPAPGNYLFEPGGQVTFLDFGLVKHPLAAYAQIPRSYVILQRINLGLFAILGEMNATADWRGISEEIWPFVQAPPSTPLGEAEAPWLARARR
jgi:hypothetical protein